MKNQKTIIGVIIVVFLWKTFMPWVTYTFEAQDRAFALQERFDVCYEYDIDYWWSWSKLEFWGVYTDCVDR